MSDPAKTYGATPASQNEQQTKPYAKGAITAVGVFRVAAGVGLLIAPQFFGGLFHVPITAQSAFIGRLVGGRDFVLGELLLTADGNSKDRKEVKRALWAGIAADVLDIGALGIAFASGQISRTSVGLFGGGATALVLLGTIGLRSLH